MTAAMSRKQRAAVKVVTDAIRGGWCHGEIYVATGGGRAENRALLETLTGVTVSEPWTSSTTGTVYVDLRGTLGRALVIRLTLEPDELDGISLPGAGAAEPAVTR